MDASGFEGFFARPTVGGQLSEVQMSNAQDFPASPESPMFHGLIRRLAKPNRAADATVPQTYPMALGSLSQKRYKVMLRKTAASLGVDGPR